MKIPDEVLDAMAASSPEQAEMVAQIREGQAAKARLEAEAEAAGDWETLLMFADSKERGPVLLRALQATDDDVARQLLSEWFNIVDAFGDLVGDFRAQFDRLGFVTDDLDGKMPDLPQTVYRAQWGKDPEPTEALSWTLRRDVAERFARGFTGPRSRYVLGTYREDDEPVIWKATVHEAYGWFIGRGESEIIPKRLTDLQMVARLVKA